MERFKKFEEMETANVSESERLTLGDTEVVFMVNIERGDILLHVMPTSHEKLDDPTLPEKIERDLEKRLGMNVMFNPKDSAGGFVFTTSKYQLEELFGRLLQ